MKTAEEKCKRLVRSDGDRKARGFFPDWRGTTIVEVLRMKERRKQSGRNEKS